MKKLRLKSWVEYLLAIINFIALLVMGSESSDTLFFIASHIIAAGLFTINSMILIRYGRGE